MSIFEMTSRLEFFLFGQESINWMSGTLIIFDSCLDNFNFFKKQSKQENFTKPLKLVC